MLVAVIGGVIVAVLIAGSVDSIIKTAEKEAGGR